MKQLLILLLFFTFPHIINAQNEEINLYKSILKKGDSISKTKVDTIQIFKIANKLDKKHPSQYFDEMANYLKIEKYNEAAFLFYLGQMRYKYYNAANPKYQPGNDGALLASLKIVLGEPINLYTRINADNFINILALSKQYYKDNDYKFYPKKKDEEKYNVQIKNVDELIKTIENEKLSLETKWKEERQKYIELYFNK